MHPCSRKSPVRDYFPEMKASLLEEIPRQGLFSRGGCIPAEEIHRQGLFSRGGCIPAQRIPRQGLFSRGESIPAQRNPLSGIIFPRRKHPCSEKSTVRDYFPETKASLLREFSRQGLFSRGKSIPAQRNSFSGIIFPKRKHPCSKKSPVRDYFLEADASLLGEIPFQGLFSRCGCIPARRNLPSGIIFPRRMHPCSEKSLFRDYFSDAKASLLEGIPRQGLFSRGGSIPA